MELKLEHLHQLCFANKAHLESDASGQYACVHCCARGQVSEITRYTADNTALCPRCDVDALLPSAAVDDDQLARMAKHWFQ